MSIIRIRPISNTPSPVTSREIEEERIWRETQSEEAEQRLLQEHLDDLDRETVYFEEIYRSYSATPENTPI